MERKIYRDRALKHYIQGREKEVLPHIVAPHFFAFMWIIIILLCCLIWLAWSASLPIYTTGAGLVIPSAQHSTDQAQIIIFLPQSATTKITEGQPINLQDGQTTIKYQGIIESASPYPLSPTEIRRHYKLDASVSNLVTQPSIVVNVKPEPNYPITNYIGAIVIGEVQIGSRRIISLLPILDKIFGE
jgi:hypothetical protein